MTLNRRILILLLTVLIMGVPASAQNVASFFFSEPGRVFPLISPGERRAMVKYYKGTPTSIENEMGEDSKLVFMDSTYLCVSSSEAKTVEILMFSPSKRDTLLAVIETFSLPAADSKITVFNTKWEPQQLSRYFVMPAVDEFFRKDAPAEKVAFVKDVLPFPLVHLRFKGEKHDVIVAELPLEEFLVSEDYEKVKPHINDKLYYPFNGKKFKLSKSVKK